MLATLASDAGDARLRVPHGLLVDLAERPPPRRFNVIDAQSAMPPRRIEIAVGPLASAQRAPADATRRYLRPLTRTRAPGDLRGGRDG